jgi:hypothetical protein
MQSAESINEYLILVSLVLCILGVGILLREYKIFVLNSLVFLAKSLSRPFGFEILPIG